MMRLTVELNDGQEESIDRLFETGLYGKSKQETIVRMMDEGIITTFLEMGEPVLEKEDNG